MARQPQRGKRPTGRKSSAALAKAEALAATRPPRRKARATPKDPSISAKPKRKISAGRGRPAVFTREDILEAAKAAFSKDGYANITIDDLAARLKTSKGTLYYHSNRKVDLLIAISTDAVSRNAAGLCAITSIEALIHHRIALAMRALMHGVLSDLQAAKVYFENEADLPLKFRLSFRRQLREIQSAICNIVSEGVAAGMFRGDPNIVTKHILSVCAWPYRWFSMDGKLSIDAFIDSAISFVLGGVLADPKADLVAEAILASTNHHAALPLPESLRERAKT